MVKQKPDFPPIPLKRYFTLEECCALACIDTERFLEWQSEHNLPFGVGGQFYSRQDVLSLRTISPTINHLEDQPKIEDMMAQIDQLESIVGQAKEKLEFLREYMSTQE